MSKSPEYLAGKIEGMEKEIGFLRQEIGDVKKQAAASTRWILIATGFLSAIVFASHILEWYFKLGGHL